MEACPRNHPFSIHPLNKLQKTIHATMAQKLLSYNNVIISSTPWHRDSYHTTMSSYLPSHIVTDFYHTTMSSYPPFQLSYKETYHTPMLPYPPPHDTNTLTIYPYCPFLHLMTQRLYHTPMSSYLPPHETKTLLTHPYHPVFHPKKQRLLSYPHPFHPILHPMPKHYTHKPFKCSFHFCIHQFGHFLYPMQHKSKPV